LKQAAQGTHRDDERRYLRQMSEQARKIEHEAIPRGAQGLYYNKGLFSEVLAYYDDEALYFECRGKDSGIVRFSFEMLQTLGEVIDEEQEEEQGHENSPDGKRG
jgi:hypothetical protein